MTVLARIVRPPVALWVPPTLSGWCEALHELIRPHEVQHLIRWFPRWALPAWHSFPGAVAAWIRDQRAQQALCYFADPVDVFGRDLWRSPGVTIRAGGGDCEDFSILVASLLRAGGADAYVALGVIRRSFGDEGHAWVVGEDERGLFGIEAVHGILYRGEMPASYIANLVGGPDGCQLAA